MSRKNVRKWASNLNPASAQLKISILLLAQSIQSKTLRHLKASDSKHGQKNTFCAACMLIWNMDHQVEICVNSEQQNRPVN